MNKVVFLGGFGSSAASVEPVGNALGQYFGSVEALPLADFVDNPEMVTSLTRQATLITHSAGALALEHAQQGAERAYLLNPPLPRQIGCLALRSIPKTFRMFTAKIGEHNKIDFASAWQYSINSTKELTLNPRPHIGSLGRISVFDAVDTAEQAISAGTKTSLYWTTNDSFFKPSNYDLARATSRSIPVQILPGEHDEVLLRPEQFLAQIFPTTS